jgi:hypothetical protein
LVSKIEALVWSLSSSSLLSDEKNETEEINQLFENPDIDPSEVDRAAVCGTIEPVVNS